MRDIRHAGEVGGVIQGGGELRDAAADRGIRAPVEDDAGLHVPLRGAARAGVAVQGERLARVHNRAVDGLGHQRNVGAGRARVAAGGERADHVVEGGVLRLFGGELRGHVLVHRVPRTGFAAGQPLFKSCEGGVPVHHGAVDGRLDAAAGQHAGIFALHLGLRKLVAQDGARGIEVHVRCDAAFYCGELHDLPDAVLRHRGGDAVLAGDGDRAVQGGAHGAAERGLHGVVVDRGLRLRRLQFDTVWVEPAGGDLVAQGGAVHVLAQLRIGRFGLAALHTDGAVDGVHVQLFNHAVELAAQGFVVDGRHDVHFSGGEQPAESVHGVGGLDAGGVHRGVEVDAQARLRRDKLGGLLPRLHGHGLVGDTAEFCLELLARLIRRHRTDVHAADLSTAGDVAPVGGQVRQVDRKRHGEDAQKHT